MYWDAHCHLTLMDEPDHVISDCTSQKVSGFVQGGIDHSEWKRQLNLPRSCIRAFGIHPWTISKLPEQAIQVEWEELLKMHHLARAIGECGLDYVYKESKDRQKGWFQKHLELAQDQNKPVICHVVRAHADALEMLKPFKVRGLVHGFSGSLEVAESYFKRELLVSIGPNILKAGFKKLKKAIPYLPLEKLVLESDAPDQDPSGVQGPLSILAVARELGRILDLSPKDILKSSTKNLKHLFGESYEPT